MGVVKLNPAYLVMAGAVVAVWKLRSWGMSEEQANTVLTFLVLGLGFTPAPGQASGTPKVEPHVEVTRVDAP